ncbi:hypothetical protein [Legionella fallonii]|nr:hypothetical protein [Legionella fallonii]
MLRQSIIYLLLSILVVVFARYAHLLIVYIDMFFAYVNYHLAPIFSQTGWGPIIRKVIVLMLMPIIITAIPALIYRLIKGHDMPNFIAIVWIVWAVIVLSNILVR